jgi:hypothetical protein
MANNQQLLLGEGAGSAPAVYIEDVFSTYLYTGTGSTQTITNNIDLSTKGGLVWVKARSAVGSHILRDSARGPTNALITNETYAQGSGYVTTFTSTGYTDGTVITNGATFASWTFREQPKFFDVVTWTGNGTFQPIPHNLGALPGFIIYKATSTTSDWFVLARKDATDMVGLKLNTADAAGFTDTPANLGVTSTTFDPVYSWGNTNGVTYVAYLFAHDAGGFGLAGTDNVISCGSFTTDGSGYATVNLGYEPQWILYKRSSAGGVSWAIVDSMRGLTTYYGTDNQLFANTSAAEVNNSEIGPTATGFTTQPPTGQALFASSTYIYIAIRRGPMKVPTVGTSVFSPLLYAADGAASKSITGAGFTPSMSILFDRSRDGLTYTPVADRLRGIERYVETNNTNSESNNTNGIKTFDMNGVTVQTGSSWNNSTYVSDGLVYLFCRAPGFFDEVCYTGTSANRTLPHNLTVAPELIIQKSRAPDPGAVANRWLVGTNFGATTYRRNWLELTDASTTYAYTAGAGFSGQPTSSNFFITDNYNASGTTYVAYLFATCAGVSKVGSYTGNGSSQTIACGFTAGSRFVMIKRTDSTGDWYVWDSARGIVAGNDPHLSLNDTAAEVTTDDSVDTDNSGFIVNQVAATNVNVTSATYIFLAIA